MKNMKKATKNQLFFNRDLSWLKFNKRVMAQTVSENIPLLERLRFIDIFKSNTDEFFMKRAGYIYRNEARSYEQYMSSSSMSDSLYSEIRETVCSHWLELQKNFDVEIVPKLQKQGIHLFNWNQLTEEEHFGLTEYFKSYIFPILTPLGVDPGRPFPFISNLSKSVAVCLRKPDAEKRFFARVKIPSEIPQWIRLPHVEQDNYRFVNLDEIVLNNLESLFFGMKVESSAIFKITRDVAVNVDEGDEIEDVMEWLEEELKGKRFAPVVRLEIEKGADKWLKDYLTEELHLKEDQVFEMQSKINYTSFSNIIDLPFPKLKFKPYKQGESTLSPSASNSKNL
jgi:polyphosphate kinase